MVSSVKITSAGIKKILRNYNSKLAIAEYIWNGFDAKANTVYLDFSFNEFDSIDEINITDNGYGIDINKITKKFNPFYESEKIIEISSPKHISTMHGKNGVGRLTFFTFANNARWVTTFHDGNKLASGSIEISVDGLNTYQPTYIDTPLTKKTGTTVSFFNVSISKAEMENTILPFLICEFCWYLELNKSNNFQLIVNGIPLNYNSNIVDYVEDQKIIYKEG